MIRVARGGPAPAAIPRGVAIVTGSSSGLGQALARELHRRGWRVGLVARRAERLEALATELGEGTAWAAADVRDAPGLFAAVRKIERALGACDLIVANAGTSSSSSLTRLDPEEAARTLRVNVEGVVHSVAAVLPGMLERNAGHVAAVSSLAGEVGLPMAAIYLASKAAVTRFMDCLRLQARPRGIVVTTILPGFLATDMLDGTRFPKPFLLQPDEAARRIADGLERRKARILFPWPTALAVAVARRLPTGLYDRIIRLLLPVPRPKNGSAT
ncbi:MAG: SDR family NAD(P)-dependent oxidoreductase [Deltaproteobacteria bacterium]|nr:SDR family NAD(P)-dependent oxidoreductase [Deltaproteobacteria bacterium]